MTAYELFQEILVGDFDNRNQVEAEKIMGNQVHPFAVHVNRLFTHRVEGLPSNFEGCYILEESYYTYPNQAPTIKPHLFHIEAYTDGVAQLTPTQIPEHWDLKDVRNDNPDLTFDYSELKPIVWFKPALYYQYRGELHTNSPQDLGGGKRFSLIETLSKNRLQVMELMEENGVRLTPYATPIVYERID